MGLIRPATPGFVVTLVATILLVVVTFCVPYFKSVYFLRADISVRNVNGSITFGTLGYCLQLSNGTTCSKPSIGYQLDINGLVGNNLPVQIPQVAVKWLTYALFLHAIGLILAAGSALFGLLAHVREMSMACCSTCISGFAAAITLLAFIFDVVLFFVAKARINAVGSASIGNAVWLTLAAWILLFFSGCFFTLGRCCISKRGPRNNWGRRGNDDGGGPDTVYAERMRLDAVKAEADRKAKQKAGENGLPSFQEYQPLTATARIDGDAVYTDNPYRENDTHSTNTSAYHNRTPLSPTTPGGYMPAPAGTRAVDEYFHPTTPTAAPASSYPPRPPHGRQASLQSHAASPPPQAAPSRQGSTFTPTTATSYPAPNQAPSNQYLTATGNDQAASGHAYGHLAGGSSYHTATSHQQQPTTFSSHTEYDPYNHTSQSQPVHYAEPSFNPSTYNTTAILPSSSPPLPVPNLITGSPPNPYLSNTQPTPTSSYTTPARSYTLGGDGYGGNSVPPLPDQGSSPNYQYHAGPNSYPAPINTNTGYPGPVQTSPVRGPRSPPTNQYSQDDAPPGYESGPSSVIGHWGKR